MIIHDIGENSKTFRHYLEIRSLVKRAQRGDDAALSELVRKAQKGDKEAFDGIADILLPKLVFYFLSNWSSLVKGATRDNPEVDKTDSDEALSYKLLSGKSLALSELVINTLVKVAKGLPRFRAESNLRTWAERIARNVAIDYGRNVKRLLTWEIEQAETEAYLKKLNQKRRVEGKESIDYDEYISFRHQFPEGHIEESDIRRIENTVVFLETVHTTQGLTNIDKAILNLFYGSKYELSEIAEDLDLTIPAVKMRKVRALYVLKGINEENVT